MSFHVPFDIFMKDVFANCFTCCCPVGCMNSGTRKRLHVPFTPGLFDTKAGGYEMHDGMNAESPCKIFPNNFRPAINLSKVREKVE